MASGIGDDGKTGEERFDLDHMQRFIDPDTGKLDLWGYLNSLPEGEPTVRKGHELGHKAAIALQLIGEVSLAGDVRLRDVQSDLRRFINSKSHVLVAMGLITERGHQVWRMSALGRDRLEAMRWS